ncbi:MAG TPA: chromate transporter [Thermoflexales bacterium]|nr:chromate transporter [Thermoflexales bacterium]
MVEHGSGTKNTPTLLQLLAVWLKIGLTSFGGGPATQVLIYQHFVTQRKWIEPEAFAQMWAVVQFAPGVNLIALAILMGNTLAGAAGVVVSLIGMLLPSAGITIIMTAAYATVRSNPAVQKALRGVTPALVGMSIVFLWRLLKPPMHKLQKNGSGPVLLGVVLVLCAMALTAFNVPILVIYFVGAFVLGVAYTFWARQNKTEAHV